MYRILTVNPGSTSTKVAVYEDENHLISENFVHTAGDLSQFKNLIDQLDYRKDIILSWLKEKNFDMSTLSAVGGRGGTLPPVKTGGYWVNEEMKNYLIKKPRMVHASNLGALLADAIAKPLNIPAYIYDAVTAGELLDIAKITGFPEIERQSFCHVLNSRAMSIKVAKKYGKTYNDMNFIVAHMGGGISMSAHSHGKLIDSISDDSGPFAPDRSGSINLMYLVDLCYSGEYNRREILTKIRGMGGLKAHLGTHDCRLIEKMIENGDEHAKLIYEAQGFQICKGIGMMAGVFEEPIDAIILTGGLANSKMLMDMVVKRVKFIAPIEIIPGEDELEAMALGGLRILRGEEQAWEFVDNE